MAIPTSSLILYKYFQIPLRPFTLYFGCLIICAFVFLYLPKGMRAPARERAPVDRLRSKLLALSGEHPYFKTELHSVDSIVFSWERVTLELWQIPFTSTLYQSYRVHLTIEERRGSVALSETKINAGMSGGGASFGSVSLQYFAEPVLETLEALRSGSEEARHKFRLNSIMILIPVVQSCLQLGWDVRL